MTKEQAHKLEELFEAGYLIIIDAYPLLDGPVLEMFKDWDTELDRPDEVFYTSHTYTSRPLAEVSVDNVQVFTPDIPAWPEMEGSMEAEHADRWENTLCKRQNNAKD